MAMGTPVGGIHRRTAAAEMLGQGDGLRRAGSDHRRGHAADRFRCGAIDCGGPAQAEQAHHQPHQHDPKRHLALVLPVTAE